MTTIVHVTFSGDGEARHFAAMLAEEHGVVVRPADPGPHADASWEELWPEPETITAIGLECDGAVTSIGLEGRK